MTRLLLLATMLLFLGTSENFAQKKNKKNKKDAEKAAPAPKPRSRNGIKPYGEIITKYAITDHGLFTTHKVDDKYYFEIADSLIDREFLVVSRISGTIEGFNFGGAGMKAREQQVWRWQKFEDKILLRSVSYDNVSDETQPIYQSVRKNNFEPIIMSFDIKAYSKDSSSFVIDVDQLFTTDVETISPVTSGQRKQFGVRGADRSRSLILWTKSFPMNTEVRHIITYNASQAPSNAETGTISLELNQSMILLPAEPMMPRLYDRRVGFFTVSQTDYGLEEHKATKRSYIARWRLEPKDMAAYKRGELVEPIKPIVYYLDPATPVKWRKYLKEGIEAWNVAFEAAGFKNAIMAKDAPTKEEDPDWSPEDVRYSVLRYTANPIQNAMGPHVSDPRTGEILESDIIWYHNVMNLLRNWSFVQTAAVNENVRSVKYRDEVMGELIRFVSAHEVGHTLGFPHNMGSSHAYPVDSLRSPTFTKVKGTAPSIMDYARFNYVAQPGDNASLFPGVGTYDIWNTKWGYSVIDGATTPEEETDTLNAWIKAHEGDPEYWYGKQQGLPVDPRNQTEDLGDDAMKASDYGIENLKRIVPNLMKWTAEEGENYDEMEELYGQIVGQWGRYNGHVAANIGGLYETHKTYDQEGAVYEFVPQAIQERAMAWMQKQTFATPTWLLNADLLDRIEGAGTLNRIGSKQISILNTLLDSHRIGRLTEGEAKLGTKAYTPLEMLQDLRKGIWSELGNGKAIDVYRRNIQRAYITKMGSLMDSGKDSDVLLLSRAELETLQRAIKAALPRFRDTMSKYHLEASLVQIEEILDIN